MFYFLPSFRSSRMVVDEPHVLVHDPADSVSSVTISIRFLLA